MPYITRAPDRPGGVIAIGIINIVLACCLFVCHTCDGLTTVGLMFNDQDPLFQDLNNFMSHAAPSRPLVLFGAVLFGFIEAMALVVSGIALLAMQSWGRGLAIFMVIPALAVHLGRPVYELVIIRPALDRFIMQNNVAFAGPEVRGLFMVFTVIHFAMDVLLVLYWVVVLLVLVNHRVRGAFQAAEGLAGAAAPRPFDQTQEPEWRPAHYRPEEPPPPGDSRDDWRYR